MTRFKQGYLDRHQGKFIFMARRGKCTSYAWVARNHQHRQIEWFFEEIMGRPNKSGIKWKKVS